MKKINGSLGFTLRKAEDGHRNHTVRALVKKPAIFDGRIKPGDEIITVSLYSPLSTFFYFLVNSLSTRIRPVLGKLSRHRRYEPSRGCKILERL